METNKIYCEDCLETLHRMEDSGTVAKAARDLGRQYIGSELNPDYIIMTEERLGLL